MSEHRFPPIPTAIYGIVLFAAAIAYVILQTALLRAEGEDSRLRVAIGSECQGQDLTVFVLPRDRPIVRGAIARPSDVRPRGLIWLVPDRRVERHLTKAPADTSE